MNLFATVLTYPAPSASYFEMALASIVLLTPAQSTELSGGSDRSNGMRPIGTAEELQRRRIRAVELVEQGESPDEVAHFLGCGRSSVYTWVKLAKLPIEALAARPHPGPKPRLTAEQLKGLEALLLQGAKAHGWRAELWTAARAAELIQRRFKIRFHPEHVRKLLKRRLRWTSQKPQRKAKERDEVAIDH